MSTKLPEVLRDRALQARGSLAVRRAHEWLVSAAPFEIRPINGRPFSVRVKTPRKRVAMLSGCPGSGKSVAAGWGALFAEAHSMHFGDGAGYYHAREIASCAEWKSDVWDAFDQWAIVVVDDVGTERDASRCADVIERCFNHRLGPTILTTNLTGEEFLARYGTRVSSRIRGESLGIVCPAVDMRNTDPELPEYRAPHDRPFGGTSTEPFLSQAEADEYRAELERQADERRRRESEEMSAVRMRRAALEVLDDVADERRLEPVVDFDEDKRRAELRGQMERLSKRGSDG